MAHHPDRRDVALGLTSLATLSTVAVPAFAGPVADHLSFLVVGDWGRRGQSNQRQVGLAMEAAAKELECQFILSVGDNFYPDGVDSVTDAHWKVSFEHVYDGPHLQVPWYVALGNHDYHGAPQAQIDYALTSHRWRMPSRYYKLDGVALGFEGLELFCLDTTALMTEFTENRIVHTQQAQDRQRADEQLSWLDEALGKSTAAWKLVYGHHTIRSGGGVHGDTPEMVERVLPILQRHHVPVYICGHDHDLQHIVNDGLNYILTGAGSEVRPVSPVTGSQFWTATPGFTAVSLTANRLSFEFRDSAGVRLHAATVLRS